MDQVQRRAGGGRMLKENTLFGTRDKVAEAIQRLRSFEPEDGYYVAFSGGKDSQCIYHLCEMAGVKFDAHYSVTSVDPPELVRFIKKNYPNVSRDIPHDKDGKPITMWNLIPKKAIPPTRIVRYCCAELKEKAGEGRVTVTGVRWAESARRKHLHGVANVRTKDEEEIIDALNRSGTAMLNDRGSLIMNDDNDENRRTVENCYRTRKVLVNPIVDWEDEDVWEFLNNVAKVPHCELYDQGYKRLGCIGCPMNTRAAEELEKYPKYKSAYLRVYSRMIEQRKLRGLETKIESWDTPEGVYKWVHEGRTR
jgi:phosphoadenosine phosphosulfate reductase